MVCNDCGRLHTKYFILHITNIHTYTYTFEFWSYLIAICITFTWLNAAATITHVVKLDVATVQRRLPFGGSVYYTEVSSMWLLFNNYNSIELKNKLVQLC